MFDCRMLQVVSHIFAPDKLTGRFRQHAVRLCEADSMEGSLPVVLGVHCSCSFIFVLFWLNHHVLNMLHEFLSTAPPFFPLQSFTLWNALQHCLDTIYGEFSGAISAHLRFWPFEWKLEAWYRPTACWPRILRRFVYVLQASFRPQKLVFEDVDLSEMDVEKELGGYPLAVLSLTYTHKSVPRSQSNIKGLRTCSHLTSAFAVFFDLCCQMQTLSMNTIICCHRTHS